MSKRSGSSYNIENIWVCEKKDLTTFACLIFLKIENEPFNENEMKINENSLFNSFYRFELSLKMREI